MSIFGSSGGQQQITIVGVSSPQITEVPLLLASTEYSIVFPAGTKRYLIKLRDSGVELKLRYISGGDYLTIPRGCNYSEDEISAATLTIYVESVSSSQIVELVTWS